MKNPTAGSQTFSLSWAVGIFICHIAVSAGIYLLVFVSGMANFTTGTGWFHSLLIGALFIVSPPLMLELSGSGISGAASLLLALCWSLFVGGLAGLIRALSRRPVVYPDFESEVSTNPDLAGTPWAKDPHHVQDASRNRKKAEQ
jgi:hypothetical protein